MINSGAGAALNLRYSLSLDDEFIDFNGLQLKLNRMVRNKKVYEIKTNSVQAISPGSESTFFELKFTPLSEDPEKEAEDQKTNIKFILSKLTLYVSYQNPIGEWDKKGFKFKIPGF